MMNPKRLFVTCQLGTENDLVQELQSMGLEQARAGSAGVFVDLGQDGWDSLMRINYESRLASRVLWPLTKFSCRDKKELYQRLKKFPWKDLFAKDKTFLIDAKSSHPEFSHSLYAAQVAKDAICDGLRESLGWRPSIDLKNPDLRLHLYLSPGTASISFDTSHEPLFKRGLEKEVGNAPVRDTTASLCLQRLELGADTKLIDPMCGSGTFLLEAASLLTKTPSQYHRKHFGFFTLPDFPKEAWLRVKKDADAKRTELDPQTLVGVDLHPELAKENWAKTDYPPIKIVRGDFRQCDFPEDRNLLICNPPYGQRLDFSALETLYRELGDFIKKKLAKPARAGILTANLDAGKRVGLRTKKRHVLKHGGQEGRLLEYDVY